MKPKINKILTVALLVLPSYIFAKQNDTIPKSKHSIYLELGGKGVIYSLNYDRRIPITKYFGTFIGMGFTHIETHGSIISFNLQMLTPEVGLYFGNKHLAEIGYSKAIIFNYIEGAELQSIRFGYRYQNNPKGLMFRASFCPLYTNDYGGSWFPSAGISIGYSF